MTRALLLHPLHVAHCNQHNNIMIYLYDVYIYMNVCVLLLLLLLLVVVVVRVASRVRRHCEAHMSCAKIAGIRRINLCVTIFARVRFFLFRIFIFFLASLLCDNIYGASDAISIHIIMHVDRVCQRRYRDLVNNDRPGCIPNCITTDVMEVYYIHIYIYTYILSTTIIIYKYV